MRRRVFQMWANTNDGHLPVFGQDIQSQDPCIFPTRDGAEMNQEDGDMAQRVKVTIEPIGKPRKPKDWCGL